MKLYFFDISKKEISTGIVFEKKVGVIKSVSEESARAEIRLSNYFPKTVDIYTDKFFVDLSVFEIRSKRKIFCCTITME